jgi:heptose I phosphotransferase
MQLEIADHFHAKQRRSTCRWVLPPGKGVTVYLKRHYRLGWWHGVLAAIAPHGGWSPALKEWRNLERAQALGLAVPEPLAAGEFIGPWGRLQSFLAIRELTGMMPLHEAIPLAKERSTPLAFRNWKREVVRQVVDLIRPLHDRSYFHKDLYLCHFYVPSNLAAEHRADQERLHLIDFHRLKRHKLLWPLFQVKDLAQLFFSSHILGIEVRDRVQFWRLYTGARRPNWMWKLVLRAILFKSERYQRHADRKVRRLALGSR